MGLIELVDVVDAMTGEPNGIRKPKSDVHRDGDWHRSAHVWIVTPQNQILLQRRALAKENHPGMWDVSSAGHVSAGESAVDAAIRETGEELGVALDPADLDHVGITRETHVLHDGKYIDNEIHDVFLVRRDVDLASLRLQDGEVDAARLVSVDELRAMIRRGDLVDHAHEYALLFALL